jgi:hypothetical protein
MSCAFGVPQFSVRCALGALRAVRALVFRERAAGLAEPFFSPLVFHAMNRGWIIASVAFAVAIIALTALRQEAAAPGGAPAEPRRSGSLQPPKPRSAVPPPPARATAPALAGPSAEDASGDAAPALAPAASDAEHEGHGPDCPCKGFARSFIEYTQGLDRFSSWAGADPRAAASWVRGQPPGSGALRALEIAMESWARRDLASARSWARSLTNEVARTTAIKALACETAKSDTAKALEVVGDLPRSEETDIVVVYTLRQVAAIDPVEAARWALTTVPSDLRPRALENIADAWKFQEDTAQSAILAADHIGKSRAQDEAMIRLAAQWAEADPASAASWIETFPTGEVRRAAIDTVASVWSARDPEAASQFLDRQWR